MGHWGRQNQFDETSGPFNKSSMFLIFVRFPTTNLLWMRMIQYYNMKKKNSLKWTNTVEPAYNESWFNEVIGNTWLVQS